MIPRRRFPSNKRKGKTPPKPYRSWLEYDLHKGKLSELPYEPHHVLYDLIKRNRRYTPDFISGDKLIEAKGRFLDNNEAQKYVQIKNNGYEVCFIFQNPNTPLCWAKKKKDGTRTTHGEWATSHGFEWCGLHDIPHEWTRP